MKKIMTLIMLSSICLMLFNLIPNITPQTPPPPTGDWDIFDTTVINNSIIVLTGNLTVHPGGSLTLDNVTLIMNNTYDGEFGIIVNGTLDIVNGSNITANDPSYEFFFGVGNDASFIMTESELHECGYSTGSGRDAGLLIQANDTLVKNNILSNNFLAITYYSINNIIENNTIISNYNGIWVDTSFNNTIINNIISFNTVTGIWVMNSFKITLINNTANSDLVGIALDSSHHNILIGNTANSNGRGITLGDGSDNNIFIGNTANSNGGEGFIIYTSANNTLINNTANNNNRGIDMSGARNITLRNFTSNSSDNVGFYIRGGSTNITMIDIIVNGTKANAGIFLANVNDMVMINSTISNSSLYDLYLTSDSHATLLNTSFNESKVYFNDADSTLTIQWFMNANVTNSSDDPIQDANVSVYNVTDDVVASGNTSADGFLRWIVVTERIQNSTTNITYTPHNVTVSKGGYNTGYAQPEPIVDRSLNVNIMLISTLNYPPSVTVNAPINGNYAGIIWLNTTILDVNGDGDSATYMYKIDSGAWMPLILDSGNYWNASIDTTTLLDGSHTIYIIANDTLGNSNATEFVTIDVDNTAPIVTINSPITDIYAGIISLNTTIIDEADNGDPATYKYKIDLGTWEPLILDTDDYWLANIDTTTLSDGSHTIYVIANDILGNSNITESVVIDVDNTGPTVTINSPSIGIYAGTIQLNTTIIDEAGNGNPFTYMYKIDSGPWMPLTLDSDNYWNASIDSTTLIDGPHSIYIIATDTLGNSNATEFVIIDVDNTAPIVTINFPFTDTYAGIISLNTTIIDESDNGDPSTYKYRIDLGLWESLVIDSSNYWDASIDTTTLTDGSHTIYIIANDILGNSNSTESLTIYVDNSAPSIIINSPSAGIYAGTVKLNITIIDVGGNGESTTYKYRMDTETWINLIYFSDDYWEASIETKEFPDGPHTIYIIANDSLGNSNITESVIINVDNTGPIITINSPVIGIYRGVVRLNVTILDTSGNGDILSYKYKIDTQEWTDLALDSENYWIADIDTILIDDGTHTIYIRANDTLDNSVTDSIAITVDNTEPSLIITSGAEIVNASYVLNAIITDVHLNNTEIWFSIDGGAKIELPKKLGSEYQAIIDTSGLSDGPHTITVIALDTVGNMNDSESITIIVDHTPPNVILDSLPSKTTKKSLTITGRTEPNSTFDILLNGKLVASGKADANGDFDHNIELSKGDNEIIIIATDSTGNAATSTPETIRLIEEDPGTLNFWPYLIGIIVIITILLFFFVKKKGKDNGPEEEVLEVEEYALK